MLVAHLCQHGLALFFSQAYKRVLVPWMGNPSVIIPLHFAEWCSSSYWHFLLPSHLLQEEPGQGKRLLCIFSLAAAQSGCFQLHRASIELIGSSAPEGCQMYRQYEHQCGLPWVSTVVNYADNCLEEM